MSVYFELGDEKVIYDWDISKYNSLFINYFLHVEVLLEQYAEFLDNTKYDGSFPDRAESVAIKLIDMIYNDLYEDFVDLGYYGYSLDNLKKDKITYDVLIQPITSVFWKLRHELSKIDTYRALEEQHRAMRRASRGRVIGGGFGIKGFLKGAITASVINSVRDAMYDDSSEARATAREARDAKINILHSFDMAIYEAFEESSAKILKRVLFNIGQLAHDYIEIDVDEGTTIVDNILNGKIKGERIFPALIRAITVYPYGKQAYYLLLMLYPEYYVDIERIGNYFIPRKESIFKEFHDLEGFHFDDPADRNFAFYNLIAPIIDIQLKRLPGIDEIVYDDPKYFMDHLDIGFIDEIITHLQSVKIDPGKQQLDNFYKNKLDFYKNLRKGMVIDIIPSYEAFYAWFTEIKQNSDKHCFTSHSIPDELSQKIPSLNYGFGCSNLFIGFYFDIASVDNEIIIATVDSFTLYKINSKHSLSHGSFDDSYYDDDPPSDVSLVAKYYYDNLSSISSEDLHHCGEGMLITKTKNGLSNRQFMYNVIKNDAKFLKVINSILDTKTLPETIKKTLIEKHKKEKKVPTLKDLESRFYEGVLYDTKEEVELIKAEIAKIHKLTNKKAYSEDLEELTVWNDLVSKENFVTVQGKKLVKDIQNLYEKQKIVSLTFKGFLHDNYEDINKSKQEYKQIQSLTNSDVFSFNLDEIKSWIYTLHSHKFVSTVGKAYSNRIIKLSQSNQIDLDIFKYISSELQNPSLKDLTITTVQNFYEIQEKFTSELKNGEIVLYSYSPQSNCDNKFMLTTQRVCSNNEFRPLEEILYFTEMNSMLYLVLDNETQIRRSCMQVDIDINTIANTFNKVLLLYHLKNLPKTKNILLSKRFYFWYTTFDDLVIYSREFKSDGIYDGSDLSLDKNDETEIEGYRTAPLVRSYAGELDYIFKYIDTTLSDADRGMALTDQGLRISLSKKETYFFPWDYLEKNTIEEQSGWIRESLTVGSGNYSLGSSSADAKQWASFINGMKSIYTVNCTDAGFQSFCNRIKILDDEVSIISERLSSKYLSEIRKLDKESLLRKIDDHLNYYEFLEAYACFELLKSNKLEDKKLKLIKDKLHKLIFKTIFDKNLKIYTTRPNNIKINTASNETTTNSTVVSTTTSADLSKTSSAPVDIDKEKFTLLRKAFSDDFWDRLFGHAAVLDLIPIKKAKNVATDYAKDFGVQPTDIKVLFDNTLLGGARDGFILTDRYIIGCDLNKAIPLCCVKKIDLLKIRETRLSVIVQPMNTEIATVLNDKDTISVINKINEIIFNPDSIDAVTSGNNENYSNASETPSTNFSDESHLIDGVFYINIDDRNFVKNHIFNKLEIIQKKYVPADSKVLNSKDYFIKSLNLPFINEIISVLEDVSVDPKQTQVLEYIERKKQFYFQLRNEMERLAAKKFIDDKLLNIQASYSTETRNVVSDRNYFIESRNLPFINAIITFLNEVTVKPEESALLEYIEDKKKFYLPLQKEVEEFCAECKQIEEITKGRFFFTNVEELKSWNDALSKKEFHTPRATEIVTTIQLLASYSQKDLDTLVLFISMLPKDNGVTTINENNFARIQKQFTSRVKDNEIVLSYTGNGFAVDSWMLTTQRFYIATVGYNLADILAIVCIDNYLLVIAQPEDKNQAKRTYLISFGFDKTQLLNITKSLSAICHKYLEKNLPETSSKYLTYEYYFYNDIMPNLINKSQSYNLDGVHDGTNAPIDYQIRKVSGRDTFIFRYITSTGAGNKGMALTDQGLIIEQPFDANKTLLKWEELVNADIYVKKKGFFSKDEMFINGQTYSLGNSDAKTEDWVSYLRKMIAAYKLCIMNYPIFIQKIQSLPNFPPLKDTPSLQHIIYIPPQPVPTPSGSASTVTDTPSTPDNKKETKSSMFSSFKSSIMSSSKSALDKAVDIGAKTSSSFASSFMNKTKSAFGIGKDDGTKSSENTSPNIEEPEPVSSSKSIYGDRVCPNCGASMANDQLFCGKCGTKYVDTQNKKLCPSCGAEVEDGMKFCRICGAKLNVNQPKFCPNCGSKLAEGTKFCGNCGNKI